MKHLPKVLLPVAILLFVFSASVKAEEPNHAPVLLGAGAAMMYTLEATPGAWAALPVLYAIANSEIKHDCYNEPNVTVPIKGTTSSYQEITACEHQGVKDFESTGGHRSPFRGTHGNNR